MVKHWFIPALLVLAFLFAVFPLYGQETGDGEEEEEEETIPLESDWSHIDQQYTRGDKLFNISLGLNFPLFFISEYHVLEKMDGQIRLGGTGSLAYDHFFGPHLALGGEVGGIFARTIGKNIYYAVPIGFRITYQFVFHSLEFPLTFSLGVTPQKLLDLGYFGPFAKFQAAAFWRFTSSWSFGLVSSWLFIPQFNKNADETIYGNFSGLTVTARYHF